MTTHKVIDFLKMRKEQHVVIQLEKFITCPRFDLQKNCFSFQYQGKLIESSKISCFWYRRGNITFNINKTVQRSMHEESKSELKKHLLEEWKSILSVFYNILQAKPFIGSISERTQNNKLLNLLTAHKVGFKCPTSHVVSNINALNSLSQNTSKRFISKAIKDDLYLSTLTYRLGTFGPIDVQSVMNMNHMTDFFPSLVQEYIHKKVEIRAFAFGDRIWSMAIFSQLNSKTKLDYRRYGHDHPSRMVPYQLPSRVEQRLRDFMKIRGFTTGSFDLILDIHGEYYFLEINPVGQFEFLSYNCNYYIESEIADALIKMKKNENGE